MMKNSTKPTLEQKQEQMAKARQARSAKTPVDVDKQMFWTVPQIMDKFGLTRNDFENLVSIADVTPKSVTKGKQTKFLAVDIKAMLAKFQQ
jgi:hypothetical protein